MKKIAPKKGSKAQGRLKKASSVHQLIVLIKDALDAVDGFVAETKRDKKNCWLITSSKEKIAIRLDESNLTKSEINKRLKTILTLRQLVTLIRKDELTYIQLLEDVGQDKNFFLDIGEDQSPNFYSYLSKAHRDELFEKVGIELIELIDMILKSKPPVDLAIKLKRIVAARNERNINTVTIGKAEELSWVHVDGYGKIDLSKNPRIRAIIFELHSKDSYSVEKSVPTKSLDSIDYELGEYIKREKKNLGLEFEKILRKIFLRDFTRESIFLDPLLTIG